MTYTEDRQHFEDDIFKPPFLARMMEAAGKYMDGLDDKDVFLQRALDRFWERRGLIIVSQDILAWWNEALSVAAWSRPRWRVRHGSNLEKVKWVRGDKLGRS